MAKQPRQAPHDQTDDANYDDDAEEDREEAVDHYRDILIEQRAEGGDRCVER